MKTLTGHFLPAYCVFFDNHEQRMITGGDEGIVRIWCLKTGFMVSSIRGHTVRAPSRRRA